MASSSSVIHRSDNAAGHRTERSWVGDKLSLLGKRIDTGSEETRVNEKKGEDKKCCCFHHVPCFSGPRKGEREIERETVALRPLKLNLRDTRRSGRLGGVGRRKARFTSKLQSCDHSTPK